MGHIATSSLSFATLVDCVRGGDPDGMSALYDFIRRGMRPYLTRQLGAQDSDDTLHDVYLEVVRAIRQGQIRDAERIMGFVRTITRRKVACYIDSAARNRRERVNFSSAYWLASPLRTLDREMIFKQQQFVVQAALLRLTNREREILVRFYLQEQDEIQICAEMVLTHTQYRLLKSRSKIRLLQLSRQPRLPKPLRNN